MDRWRRLNDQFAGWTERDVIWVEGSWSGSFLQGQLTQDVLRIGAGFGEWSLIMSPGGMVEFFLRVTRVSATSWVLDIDGGWGEQLISKLNENAPEVGVEIRPCPWKALRVGFAGMVALGEGPDAVVAWVRWFPWLPLGTVDVLGPSPQVPEGFPLIGSAELEFRRIRSSFPRMGSEITPTSLPQETGLVEWTIGRDKTHDYVGREAWIEANAIAAPVRRQLRVLVLAGETEPGSSLVSPQGEPVGQVTSVAFLPNRGWIGLGYLNAAEVEEHVAVADSGPRVLIQPIPSWPSAGRT